MSGIAIAWVAVTGAGLLGALWALYDAAFDYKVQKLLRINGDRKYIAWIMVRNELLRAIALFSFMSAGWPWWPSGFVVLFLFTGMLGLVAISVWGVYDRKRLLRTPHRYLNDADDPTLTQGGQPPEPAEGDHPG